MKTHLNTLYITTQGAYLAKDGEAVVVRIEKQTALRVPLHNLDAITCFGRVGLSPPLMAACAKAGVSLTMLSERGQFLAAVVGFTPGNVLLRRQQYRWADNEEQTREAARSFVVGKLANCRTVLHRAARDAADGDRRPRLEAKAKRLGALIHEARDADTTDRLRGLEGEAASEYFASLGDLRTGADPAFAFRGRSRRPPLDPINALLSFVYTLLMSDVRSACEATGLDAAVGFLHRDRPGRPSLALDLMEEFRPWLADRFVLTLINRGQVRGRDFETLASGAVMLKEKARKTLLVAWQERKQEETTHTFLGERCTIGLLPHLQARLFVRYLRGDLDAYPPFLWR
ncbi:MAG: type I-C CRISPR-associated endonuclease Cas1c [Planctomycetota bacterium]